MTQMNPTLQAADALAQAVREASNEDDGCLYVHGHYDGKIQLALRDYERAKADEAKPVCKHDIPLTVRCDWCESETKPVAADIYAALNYYRNADFLTTEQQKIAEDALMQIDPSELTDRHAPAQASRDSARLDWLDSNCVCNFIEIDHHGKQVYRVEFFSKTPAGREGIDASMSADTKGTP